MFIHANAIRLVFVVFFLSWSTVLGGGGSSKDGGRVNSRATKVPHLGLWQCIDPIDGAIATVGIVKNNPSDEDDETYTFRLTRSFFRTCGGTQGTVVLDTLEFNEDGNLATTTKPSIRCFAPEDAARTDVELPVDSLEFSYQEFNDILQFTFQFEVNCHRLSAMF